MTMTLLAAGVLLCMAACFALGYEYHRAEPEPEPVSLKNRLASSGARVVLSSPTTHATETVRVLPYGSVPPQRSEQSVTPAR